MSESEAVSPVQPLFVPRPEDVAASGLARFEAYVRDELGVPIASYDDLWRWSTTDLDGFWRGVHDLHGVVSQGSTEVVLADDSMPGARWFPDVRISFVENVFSDRDPDAVALVGLREDRDPVQLTWSVLEAQVAALAVTLRGFGVEQGDRVVAYVPNTPESVVAFLAAASLGATWSVCAPDYAAAPAASRLAQLDPVVLVAADGYTFNGRTHDRRAEAVDLAGRMPHLRAVIHLPHLGLDAPAYPVPATAWTDAVDGPGDARVEPVRVCFDHPLWVLYSSGTTGAPKGIVHGTGGVVLEAVKIARLQLDLGAHDRLFWFTSTNWMMWNFTVMKLVSGVSVVLYDGSPAAGGADRLLRLAAEHEVTMLGVSPGYLQACQQADVDLGEHDLAHLRRVGVTGSPLAPSVQQWAQDALGEVPVLSLSGGTDVASGLAGWAPSLPVWLGELSGPQLGVALDAFDEEGRSVRGRVGELVVTRPMPTMPVSMWADPDGERLRMSYFDLFPGTWRHGDWVEITGRGTVLIHGRSDATLNRQGVRLGSADIYEVVEAMPEVLDSLVVGVEQPDGGYWMPLFVVLADDVDLDDDLRRRINEKLRTQCSPRHVPDEVIEVPAVPRTRTGKKLEVPVKRVLGGTDVDQALSRGAVEDPTALEAYVALAEQRRPR